MEVEYDEEGLTFEPVLITVEEEGPLQVAKIVLKSGFEIDINKISFKEGDKIIKDVLKVWLDSGDQVYEDKRMILDTNDISVIYKTENFKE